MFETWNLMKFFLITVTISRHFRE